MSFIANQDTPEETPPARSHEKEVGDFALGELMKPTAGGRREDVR